MSDIYLQITETPTVVTLSAPVVSGALASTVTVANTVTVALDSNSLSALENVTVTVGAAITGTVTVSNLPSTQTIAGTVTANAGISFITAVENGIFDFINNEGVMPISGTVTASLFDVTDPIQDNGTSGKTVAIKIYDSGGIANGQYNASPVFVGGTVTIGSALPTGTNRIGVVTIGGGTVTIGAGTAQIGSVTASISGTVPVSISSVTIGNSVNIGSLPAISGTVTANLPVMAWAGIYDSGNDCIKIELANLNGDTISPSNPLPISGTVTVGAVSTTVTIAHHQGTAVTTSNFTSTTASTTLVSAVAGREVLTVFNEGPANLFISPGATCTSVSYQVRLSPGDYWECPQGQQSLQHTAVYLTTGGTARVCQVS